MLKHMVYACLGYLKELITTFTHSSILWQSSVISSRKKHVITKDSYHKTTKGLRKTTGKIKYERYWKEYFSWKITVLFQKKSF